MILIMKKKWTRDEAVAFFRRAVDDKKALCECIRNGGNLREVADERGIDLVNPLSIR